MPIFILGSGIKTISHLTNESVELIESAAKVFYLVNEPIMKKFLSDISKDSFDLDEIYFSHNYRVKSYTKIVDKIICYATKNKDEDLAVVFYGHPYFCAEIGLEIKKIALTKNIPVKTFSAVSSLDCMYSDLDIDPAQHGMQIYETTHFINYPKIFDITSHLVLLQIGFIESQEVINRSYDNGSGLSKLKSILIQKHKYPLEHICVSYEASLYKDVSPVIHYISLNDIETFKFSSISMLVIPPFIKK